MANKVIVPDVGDFENVEIIEILVKSGDKIKKMITAKFCNSLKENLGKNFAYNLAF